MHPIARIAGLTWNRNARYGLALVDDIPAESFARQPVPGRTMNHPAWILSHLGVYPPICLAMLRAEPFEDPANHPFGPRSGVLGPESYEPKAILVDRFATQHAELAGALAAADEATLDRTTPLDRWRPISPTIGDLLVMLMVKHESGHLGQLSAWRRAMGLPTVPM